VLALPAAPANAGARKPPPPPKRVYTQTNSADGNAVQVFERRRNGRLVEGDTYPTGGVGRPSIAVGFPFTESQGAVTLSRDGRLLLVVNHGSDSVTSFRVTRNGLRRKSTVPSDGVGPLSVTINRRATLAYVVNEGNPATISGYRVGDDGTLTPLPNSTRTLAYPAGAPAQIGFSRSGRVLVVSDRQAGPVDEPDFLESFRVGQDGRPTALPPTPSTGQTPFGFAFTRFDVLVVTNADNDQLNQGSVSTYATANSGVLTSADLEPTGLTATCWVVISKNQKYAIVSNTVSASISVFRVTRDGQLTNVADPGPAVATVDGAPIELALSRNGKFLYVQNVDPGVIVNDPNARMDIQVYRVRRGGRVLNSRGTVSSMPPTTSGIAAW
jgi:6-phosphogluconolactonase (cycloisomerase 2 family)